MIIKLSRSLKQLQVVSDPSWSDEHQRDVCWVYGTSVVALKSLVERGDAGRFVLLSRLPVPVLPGRFPVSSVYQGVSSLDLSRLNEKRDSLSAALREKSIEESPVKDFKVDWGGGL